VAVGVVVDGGVVLASGLGVGLGEGAKVGVGDGLGSTVAFRVGVGVGNASKFSGFHSVSLVMHPNKSAPSNSVKKSFFN